MAKETSLGEYRNVKVAFDVNTGKDIVNEVAQVVAPIDFFKAAIRLVKQNEGAYATNPANVPDVTAKTTKIVGSLPNVIHTFVLTTVMAQASYIFSYVSTAPNADS